MKTEYQEYADERMFVAKYGRLRNRLEKAINLLIFGSALASAACAIWWTILLAFSL